MNVTRDVVIDLLPIYQAGEASADTRALVEEYLKGDEELARYVRSKPPELTAPPAPALPPDTELVALRRTRRLLALQRWVFALAIFFTSISLATRVSFDDGGHLTQVRPLFLEEPRLWPPLALSAVLWIAYVILRRRMRVAL